MGTAERALRDYPMALIAVGRDRHDAVRDLRVVYGPGDVLRKASFTAGALACGA